MNKKYKITDTRVPLPKAFVKLGKQEYMTKCIDEGSLRFSSALEFSKMQEGRDKIADKYERSLFYQITDLYVAPLVSDNENEIKYGKPIRVADEAIQRLTSSTIQKIPFHCLYCYDNPPINAIVCLENYEKLIKEFPDYDTAVFIYKPLEFLKKIESKFEIYANYIKYIDRTPLKEELENDIHFLYYKRNEFDEQKEFRIFLPQLRIEHPEIYQIWSLLDIAYLVPLKCLKKGIIIANNDDDFQYLKRKCEKNGIMVGNDSQFNLKK